MTLAGSRFYGTYYDSEDPERIHPHGSYSSLQAESVLIRERLQSH